MELLKPEFLTQLGIAPHVVDLIIFTVVAFGLAWWWRGANAGGEIRGLKREVSAVKAEKKAMKKQMQLALDQNRGETKQFDELRTQLLAELKQRQDSKDEALLSTVLYRLNALDAANTATGQTLSTDLSGPVAVTSSTSDIEK